MIHFKIQIFCFLAQGFYYLKTNCFLRLQSEQGKSFTICKFMLTKVRLHLYEELIPYYPELSRELVTRTNASLSAKIKQTIIELPGRPRCGELLDLLTFTADFGLSDLESEYLADYNNQVKIIEIVNCNGFLELSVKKVE